MNGFSLSEDILAPVILCIKRLEVFTGRFATPCRNDRSDVVSVQVGRFRISHRGRSGKTVHVLSIFDSVDKYAGSCQELFAFSEGKGIANYDELILNIGTGHGILYQPLDEWIQPAVQWAITE